MGCQPRDRNPSSVWCVVRYGLRAVVTPGSLMGIQCRADVEYITKPLPLVEWLTNPEFL